MRVAGEGVLGEVALGVAAAVLAALVWAVVVRLAAPTDVQALTGTLRRLARR